jgi:hypothetical protein
MVTIKGGDKLEQALKEIAKKVTNASTLGVGFLEGATYPDGTSVALVAAVNNYGSADIPARPFFTRMVKEGQEHWADDIGKLLPLHDYDARETLDLMGEKLKGELVQSITDQVYAPLKPSTVKAKGFATTLVDTSHMKNSVDAEVK